MSNGEVCCILAVCCPPASAQQKEALVHMIQKAHPDMTEARANACAIRVLKDHNYFRGVPKSVKEFCD